MERTGREILLPQRSCRRGASEKTAIADHAIRHPRSAPAIVVRRIETRSGSTQPARAEQSAVAPAGARRPPRSRLEAILIGSAPRPAMALLPGRQDRQDVRRTGSFASAVPPPSSSPPRRIRKSGSIGATP